MHWKVDGSQFNQIARNYKRKKWRRRKEKQKIRLAWKTGPSLSRGGRLEEGRVCDGKDLRHRCVLSEQWKKRCYGWWQQCKVQISTYAHFTPADSARRNCRRDKVNSLVASGGVNKLATVCRNLEKYERQQSESIHWYVLPQPSTLYRVAQNEPSYSNVCQ